MSNLEEQIIELIATDRIDIPISSMSGKLKRKKPKLAEEIDLSEFSGNYVGERVYARIESEDEKRARGMKEGIGLFSKKFPKYGKILTDMIEEKRSKHEIYLYFGMKEGCHLTTIDYLHVMTDLGFTETTAHRLYPELIDIGNRLLKKRDNERSIMIG